MRTTINTIGATIGAKLNNKIVRCTIIGSVVNNSVLIKRSSDSKIFAVTTNLVVWLNEGL